MNTASAHAHEAGLQKLPEARLVQELVEPDQQRPAASISAGICGSRQAAVKMRPTISQASLSESGAEEDPGEADESEHAELLHQLRHALAVKRASAPVRA